MAPQLILFEGISGSGKSYSSQLLSFYYKRQGHCTHWLYENSLSKAIYPAEQVATISSRKECELLYEKALKNWQQLVKEAQLNRSNITIVDAHYLQILITTMLAFAFAEEEIINNITKINTIISELSPQFIYYRQKDIAKSLQRTLSSRGRDFEHYLLEKIQQSAYLMNKQLSGRALLSHFFSQYQQILDQAFALSDFQKLTLNDPHSAWQETQAKIQQFLSINDMNSPNCAPQLSAMIIGTYQLESPETSWKIIAQENTLFLLTPQKLRLFFLKNKSFQVEGMETRIEFVTIKNNPSQYLLYQQENEADLKFVKQ